MFPINQFSIKTVSENDTEGVFHIGPLPTGYGHTVGNVYRRLLLSSIPGAAITSVRIEGVQHEYTTLSGLQDDVLSVVLAIKDIAVICHSNDPVTLKLNVKGDSKGPRTVTAADIERNPMVEIINPEQVITVLADAKAELVAEVVVEKGLGYAMPNESVREEVGAIPLDANFTPVKLVSMEVSHARVGQQTDLDQLELKVITNGTMTPSAALHTAADILVKVSEHLLASAKDLLDSKSAKQAESAELPLSEKKEVTESKRPQLRTEDLGLSTRLTNALLNSGYEDLSQLDGLAEEEVAGIKGMGEKSFQELLEILKENDITLI